MRASGRAFVTARAFAWQGGGGQEGARRRRTGAQRSMSCDVVVLAAWTRPWSCAVEASPRSGAPRERAERLSIAPFESLKMETRRSVRLFAWFTEKCHLARNRRWPRRDGFLATRFLGWTESMSRPRLTQTGLSEPAALRTYLPKRATRTYVRAWGGTGGAPGPSVGARGAML